MGDDEDNKTEMAFEAIIEDAKQRGIINQEGAYRVKRRFRINSEAGRLVIKLRDNLQKYPIRWIATLIASGSGGSAWYFDLISMI